MTSRPLNSYQYQHISTCLTSVLHCGRRYGCANYGYNLWDTMQQDLCTDSKASGLTAAVFFVTFIVIS